MKPLFYNGGFFLTKKLSRAMAIEQIDIEIFLQAFGTIFDP